MKTLSISIIILWFIVGALLYTNYLQLKWQDYHLCGQHQDQRTCAKINGQEFYTENPIPTKQKTIWKN